jgi:hypothetical protein
MDEDYAGSQKADKVIAVLAGTARRHGHRRRLGVLHGEQHEEVMNRDLLQSLRRCFLCPEQVSPQLVLLRLNT